MHWATAEELRKLGSARRKQVKRADHGQLKVKARALPALELLERSMRGRVPALVKLKYQLMAASPFAYFRGAVPVMAADLAVLPSTGLTVQLCGDAHVRNLGAFAAPDGRLVFDINDFDETLRGPFEWDLKRLATSLMLAGRAAGHKDAQARVAVEACVASYAALMRRFAKMPLVEIVHFQVHRISQAAPVHDALRKAERATAAHTLAQLTEPAPDKHGQSASRRFKENKPTLTRVAASTARAVIASLDSYRSTLEPQRQHLLSLYRPVDVAFKVVGTGSVGTRDYCVYLEGNGPGDPLFLQVKEEPASGWSPYLTETESIRHEGQRVAEGQRAMQVVSDPFLGWTRFGGRDYLVRQLNDHKGSIALEDLAGAALGAYAEVCGELLARGHARSADPRILAGYIGAGDGFAESLASFGEAYADQTEKDWKDLKRSGRAGKP